MLSKEEGGRLKPFFESYQQQFYFRTTDIMGVAQLPEGTQKVMPGDNLVLEVNLVSPAAIDKDLPFAIREAGRTVGAGRVLKPLP
jgi:elongation factor Tu